jgi:hypothetical protein
MPRLDYRAELRRRTPNELKRLNVITDGSSKHPKKEHDMIGVMLTFRYGDKFDEQAVRKIAEAARPRFEGMKGLRSKAFTFSSGRREATNFYLWDSEELAKAFFSEQLLDQVTGLYGVRPSVQFVQVAGFVDNATSALDKS